ncbi:hypothetical protein TURU_112073 [Turdus rufiventris]|nr:hypothetical protein TURU_112073 [Turdus rufiventris]
MDLERMERWTGKSLMKLKRNMHWREITRHKQGLGLISWKAALRRRTWASGGEQAVHEPAVYPGAMKASGVLGCTGKTMASRSQEVILAHYSTLSCPGEVVYGVLHPVPGSSGQGRTWSRSRRE